MKKRLMAMLCLFIVAISASPILAQDTSNCDSKSINQRADQLIGVYRVSRATATDPKDSLEEIKILEKGLADLRETCSKAQSTSADTNPGDGSQDSPYAFGVAGDTFNDFSIQITGFLRPADRIIRNQNMFNDRPENDEVYIILNLELACAKNAKGTCEAAQFNFRLLGDMGIIYEAPYIVYDKMINIKVVKGTKAKGDIVFKVKKDDTNLRLLYFDNLFDENYVYYYAEPSTAGGIQISSTSAVNVRSGAGKNFDVVGSLPANTPTTAFGRNSDGTWLQIQEGWVFSDLVKVDGEIESLPVTAQ
ncbi:MAG: SH3 domain-containing protein [Anaerolineaceae bacterium]|nr:SH3 domain-containing protein [Anaerolineaceae bacterium]